MKGKSKVTKTQIAARCALDAYIAIGSHLEPEQRAVVARARNAVRHVR